MAAPTSPDGPSPVEVLTTVPRLSLSEAAGIALGADSIYAPDASTGGGNENGAALNDATSPDSAAQDPQFRGRRASSSASAGAGTRAGWISGLSDGSVSGAGSSQGATSSATGGIFTALNPFASSSALPTVQDESDGDVGADTVHPLDAYYGAHHTHSSDQSLPRIALHIPVRWDGPSSESIAPPAGTAPGEICVPEELQDGLAELARLAVRRNITYAHDALFEADGMGMLPDSAASQHVPAGLVPPGGRTLADGVGARWYWNVVFERISTLATEDNEADMVEDADESEETVHGYSMRCSRSTFASPPSLAQSSADAARAESPFVVTCRYTRPCDAFRALGYLLGVSRDSLRPHDPQRAGAAEEMHPGLLSALPAAHAEGGPSSPPSQPPPRRRWYIPAVSIVRERLHGHTERCVFQTLGTMIDCSRNGVLTVKSVKFLLRKLALMGYNILQLYTEDTYEIKDEPFFGYLRGGYTEAELREIDDYAYMLGIEVIPCIQTLGHLGQMLQWPRFIALRDTIEVLLADWPETYTILEKMITAASAPFRSKRIHLGMDETHGLGQGRYHSIFGQHNRKDPTRIFVEHLQKVNAICQKLELKPMIWSDMLFCLQVRNNSLLGYYDERAMPDVQGFPDEIELVYWDYYKTQSSAYSNRIKAHRDLREGQAPWMAAGSWTWSRFWTALPFTFATCRAAQIACKAPGSGVKNVFLTIWGDEGNEVDPFSSLPAWLYYADHAYTRADEVNVPLLRAKFDGIVGASFDDFVVASRLDDTQPEKQSIDDRIHFAPNTSKWLMWEEPFFGFISPTLPLSGAEIAVNYEQLSAYLFARLSTIPTVLAIPTAEQLLPTSIEDFPFNARLRFPYLLAKALSLKAGLRVKLHEAYKTQNWSELDRLAGPSESSQLSQLKSAVDKVWRYHRQMWMSMYAPFGWEIVDLRYGGLRNRLDTMSVRIARFLHHLLNGGELGIPRADEPGGDEEQVMLNPAAAESDDYEEQVTSLPELATPLYTVYASSDQLLDYHRVSRPTYC